ncbi:alpha/beta hydrolase [Actinoplanes sp. NPDC049316]|uniref:alpha/beta hydrolase n=1 Tax=Actinoplanes sp. NPDC049316 TaxID=3154727 RepID=UPI00342924A5
MTALGAGALAATDPGAWQQVALDWRAWAATAGRWVAELRTCAAGLRAAWKGAAADALAARIGGLLRRLDLFRLGCWAADQALSEFAAALARARPGGDIASATRADEDTAAILDGLFAVPAGPPGGDPPACTAGPEEVARWWAGLSAGQREWLCAARPGWVGSLDGVPAAARDRANRLMIDGLPIAGSLPDRLADGDGPRAYLLAVDPAGDGRAVVALGDPDKATQVVTQVPGMTADLASYGGELARAERIAVRAAELAPERATSAIMWLGYDAPDFLGEASGRSSANAGAPALRRFQAGLRATHEGAPARQTVVGHSYGSLVVGTAAARPGFDADSLVFVGSPGVGVDSAKDLHAPPGEVWASTSRSDIIQYAAVSPRSLVEDLVVSQARPAGALLAFGRPEDDLYFGTNPADPSFGARRFASRPGGGHLGYWDEGGPALDALAAIALGRGDVIPR